MVDFPYTFTLSDGGSIDFTVSRTTLQCAPDRVGLEVDLTNANFSTSAGSGHIDERHRNLDIRWTMGDTGSWGTASKLPTEWGNVKNVAYGPYVSHVYTAPGTYTITCTAREWSTGIEYTVSKDVTVVDPDTVYPTTRTVCINKVGDTDFTGKPTGAEEVNLDTFLETDSAWTSKRSATEPVRYLFKGGSSFTVGLNINNSGDAPGLYFGSYGTGRATITPLREIDGGSSGSRAFYIRSAYRADGVDFRMTNLDFTGSWDGTDMVIGVDTGPFTSGVLRNDMPLDIIVSECSADGMRNSAWYFSVGANNPGVAGHWIMNDCDITNIGQQYWVFAPPSDDVSEITSGGMIGCNIYPDSNQIDGGAQRFTCLRENGAHRWHMRGNFFSSLDNGNTTCKVGNTFAAGEDHIYTITNNRFEGGLTAFSVQENNSQGINRSLALDMLLESNIFIPSYSTRTSLVLHSVGGECRNNLIIGSSGPALHPTQTAEETGSYDYTGRVHVAVFSGALRSPTTADAAFERRVYNNTTIQRRLAADNNSVTPSNIDLDGTPITGNNLVVGVISGAVTQTFTSDLLAASPITGFKGPVNKTLDTHYGIVAADLITGEPVSGPAATGLIPYRDITGTIRPDPANSGAWEEYA